VSHKLLPSPEHASPKTLGGDTNLDATYFAYHIRRGDFQYEDTQLSAEEIWGATKHLLNPNITTLIYIATDERNRCVMCCHSWAVSFVKSCVRRAVRWVFMVAFAFSHPTHKRFSFLSARECTYVAHEGTSPHCFSCFTCVQVLFRAVHAATVPREVLERF
jgi:hypothetical protein